MIVIAWVLLVVSIAGSMLSLKNMFTDEKVSERIANFFGVTIYVLMGILCLSNIGII